MFNSQFTSIPKRDSASGSARLKAPSRIPASESESICTFLITLLLFALSPAVSVQAERRSSDSVASEVGDGSEARFALGLIDSAVRLADSCEPVSQGFLLLIAADTVSQVDRREGKALYATSFEASRKLPRSMARQGLQQALVSRMVNLNLDQAAELLERMDTPDIGPNPGLDIRSNLATTIVADLLKRNSPGDVERAVALLEYLGGTGQYPYPAAEQIIYFFHLQGRDWRGTDVFSEALSYLRTDDRFDTSIDQFVTLMRASQGEVANKALLGAIRTLIALADGGEEAQPLEGSQAIHTSATGRELVLQRRLPDLIEQLLVIAQRLDPSAAEELKVRYAQLRQSTADQTPKDNSSGEPRNTGQVRTVGTTSEEADENQEEQKASTALQEVRELAIKEPAKALTRADDIPLPGYRSRGLAIVASSQAARDPRAAASLLQQAEALVSELDSRPVATLEDSRKVMGAKVEALAVIAQAWANLGNTDRASALLGTGFRVVLGFLEKQAATKSVAPSGLDSAVGWLSRLAQVETGLNPKDAVGRTESISDPRFRAYVLLSVAGEIFQRAKRRSTGPSHYIR